MRKHKLHLNVVPSFSREKNIYRAFRKEEARNQNPPDGAGEKALFKKTTALRASSYIHSLHMQLYVHFTTTLIERSERRFSVAAFSYARGAYSMRRTKHGSQYSQGLDRADFQVSKPSWK